jgi:hypothetical protein
MLGATLAFNYYFRKDAIILAFRYGSSDLHLGNFSRHETGIIFVNVIL